ncbi:hypothetical protein LCGC14_0627920 [marine sediment metagenome]|uniref:Uncharacterized protein n=1 Tax=marine sediment metagenome TaxID=412755 RepID=A0A0F9RMB1_9ZZZZ
MNGIVGYTAQTKGDQVLVERSYAGVKDNILTKDFNALSTWLTEQYPNSFHVVWDLSSFTAVIFPLLPPETQTELTTKTKVFVGDTKIFSVDRWFGITKTIHLHSNFVKKQENNFFGISHWMPSGTDIPADASEIAQYGERILAGLERMNIYPSKLTSPVGVFSDILKGYDLPTIYSNEAIIDACEYCIPMMRNEWRSAFKLGFFPKVYSYDLIGAYPSFIANLPNTDKCKIQKSDTYIKSDWAIVYGEIEIFPDISPIVFDSGDGFINPKGKWTGYFTKDELNWILKRQLGKFKLKNGHFIDWLSSDKPYKKPMAKLFALRNKEDEMVNNLAKKSAQGVSGKLDQDNQDGSLGELYNPIYAAMTRSRCRIHVADFIYDNDLLDSLLAVVVDGCESLKEVPLVNNGQMGTWRLDSVNPALIAGKGEIWKPDKKPLNISYDEIMGAIKAHPNKSYYDFDGKCIDLLVSTTDADRKYKNYPKTGGDLLNKLYDSEALEIGTL